MNLSSDLVKSVGERIKEERKIRGWSQKALGDMVDVTQAAISEIERGETKESGKLISIAKAFNMDVEMLTDVHADATKPINKKEFDYSGRCDPVIIPSYDTSIAGIPDVEWNEVKPLNPMPFSQSLLEHYELPSSHSLAMLKLSTSSMEPTLSDNQLMIVDVTDKEPKSSRIYLVCIDNKLFVKRIIYTPTGWILKSDNKDKDIYPDFTLEVAASNRLNIQGRIVWRCGVL